MEIIPHIIPRIKFVSHRTFANMDATKANRVSIQQSRGLLPILNRQTYLFKFFLFLFISSSSVQLTLAPVLFLSIFVFNCENADPSPPRYPPGHANALNCIPSLPQTRTCLYLKPPQLLHPSQTCLKSGLQNLISPCLHGYTRTFSKSSRCLSNSLVGIKTGS